MVAVQKNQRQPAAAQGPAAAPLPAGGISASVVVSLLVMLGAKFAIKLRRGLTSRICGVARRVWALGSGDRGVAGSAVRGSGDRGVAGSAVRGSGDRGVAGSAVRGSGGSVG
ncbi:hypothetical protein L3i22_031910 [Actinoplanes sp. L3-i22]|nr:hypothetical protein L3i22_031910 [Actinoplanes sp. L3-i22]